jgi:GAF domain-containing protein
MSDRGPSVVELREARIQRSTRGGFRRSLNRLFRVQYEYTNNLDQQRASAVLVISLIFSFFWMVGALVFLLAFQNRILAPVVLGSVILSLIYLGLYSWVQSGKLRRASTVFLVTLVIISVWQQIPYGFEGTSAMIFTLPIAVSALLFGPAAAFVGAGLALGGLGVVAYFDYLRMGASAAASPNAIEDLVINLSVAGIMLILLAVLVFLLARSLFRWAEVALRRASQLEAAAVITETAAGSPSLNTLLNVVIERIRDAFGFYHAQVFMIDPEGRMARLEASTGRAGVALLARGHGLRVGSQSIVGQCSFLGEPVVVNDTRASNVWRPNELLPGTNAELALPLMVGKQTIGVIDVQSTEIGVFQSDDIRALEIIAQQLASTIERTRLLEQLQARANENQRLFEEAQLTLRQVEDLNRRLTREGWSDYLQARRQGGALGYTIDHGLIGNDSSWTAPMRQAYQGEQSVIVRQDQNAHIAAVPLRVRGEVIGVLEVERGGDRPWTDDELGMAEVLVERLALAVENARLFEQATQATEREQVINRIAQDVQSAETIDDILQAALTELGTVLGASRGIVQISPKDEQPRRSGTTGMLPELGT